MLLRYRPGWKLIRLPDPGEASISIVPPSWVTRSFRMRSPRPLALGARAASGSKPRPFSSTTELGVRESLARQIADFRAGFTPLVVPVTMVRHYVEQLGIDYLAQQTYLDPHPKELMLRNHV